MRTPRPRRLLPGSAGTAPRRACPARRRVEPCFLIISPHGRWSDADAKAGQLTVFLRQPQPGFSCARRSTRPQILRWIAGRGPFTPGLGCPASANNVAMPAQHRIRGHHHPPLGSPGARDHTERRRDQRPVRPGRLRPRPGLPPKNHELVTQRSSASFHDSSRRTAKATRPTTSPVGRQTADT